MKIKAVLITSKFSGSVELIFGWHGNNYKFYSHVKNWNHKHFREFSLFKWKNTNAVITVYKGSIQSESIIEVEKDFIKKILSFHKSYLSYCGIDNIINEFESVILK